MCIRHRLGHELIINKLMAEEKLVPDEDELEYKPFAEMQIEDQADEITKSLLHRNENSLFEFD